MSTLARKVEVSRGGLWFGLLGGASAWTIHLVLANVIAEFGCVGRLGERFFLGISLVAWLELTLTVTTMLVSGAATVVAYRGHRHLRTSAEETAERHIAWAGLLTSGMFTLIILFESIPILYYLHSC